MSYNTRKNTGNYASPISNVGQRRPAQNNFVAGGQLTPSVQPVLQMPMNQRQQQAKATPTTPIGRAPMPPKAAEPPKQSPPKPAPPQDPKIVFKAEPPAPAAPDTEPMEDDDLDKSTDDGTGKKKPFWMRNGKGGKVSKAEKTRRRNLRLKKIISPKNALMVLNELVGATTYELMEASSNIGGTKAASFHAFVTVDGQKHEGVGKNKALAKTSAAEAALKFIVMQKIASGAMSTGIPKTDSDGNEVKAEEDADGDEKMDEDKPDESDNSLSWSHLASFALHKLFNSWDETGMMLTRSPSTTSLNNQPQSDGSVAGAKLAGAISPKGPHELKPSKKMPANPDAMNPVMLLNQMHPEAIYEEVCKTGTPPRVNFTVKCTVNGQNFIGNGSTKKIARKSAAYRACRDILGMKYSPEVFEEPSVEAAAQAPAPKKVRNYKRPQNESYNEYQSEYNVYNTNYNTNTKTPYNTNYGTNTNNKTQYNNTNYGTNTNKTPYNSSNTNFGTNTNYGTNTNKTPYTNTTYGTNTNKTPYTNTTYGTTTNFTSTKTPYNTNFNSTAAKVPYNSSSTGTAAYTASTQQYSTGTGYSAAAAAAYAAASGTPFSAGTPYSASTPFNAQSTQQYSKPNENYNRGWGNKY